VTEKLKYYSMCYSETLCDANDLFPVVSNESRCSIRVVDESIDGVNAAIMSEGFEPTLTADASILTAGLYVVSHDGLTLRFCYWDEAMLDAGIDDNDDVIEISQAQ
jgi:hypothetical protein